MKVWLREVTISDGKDIVKWRNSLKVITHCLDKTSVTEESNERFFYDRVATGEIKQFIVERSDEEWGGAFGYPIGTIYLKDFDLQNRKCELGMFPGDEDEWNSESQRLAVRQILDKAFDEYGIHKVYAYVFADCKEEIAVLRECGFVQEGILVSEILDNNEYRDVIRYAIIKKLV